MVVIDCCSREGIEAWTHLIGVPIVYFTPQTTTRPVCWYLVCPSDCIIMINGVNQWLLFRAIRPEVVLVVTMTATIAAIVEERKQYCTADELSLVLTVGADVEYSAPRSWPWAMMTWRGNEGHTGIGVLLSSHIIRGRRSITHCVKCEIRSPVVHARMITVLCGEKEGRSFTISSLERENKVSAYNVIAQTLLSRQFGHTQICMILRCFQASTFQP